MEHAGHKSEYGSGERPAALDLPELYQCVHCGLCLNQCPTYQVLRLEPESPRGAYSSVKAAADGRIELNERFKEHIYLCLLCRACETACPSGVQYGRIAEAAREQLGAPGAGLARQVLNFVFAHVLPFPGRLRLIFALLRLYQRDRAAIASCARCCHKSCGPWTRCCRDVPAKFFRAQKDLLPALGPRRAKVAMLDGCVMPLIFADINDATVRVLRRNGCDVLFPEKQICCGALNTHNGESHRREADGAPQYRCFSRGECRRHCCQRRRLRRSDERIRLSAARRSRLSGKCRALQRTGKGRQRVSRRISVSPASFDRSK